MSAEAILHPVIAAAVAKDDITTAAATEMQRVFEACADWHAPTNRHSEAYSFAQRLHAIGLLDQRKTCLHRSGMFRGYRVEFRQSPTARGAA